MTQLKITFINLKNNVDAWLNLADRVDCDDVSIGLIIENGWTYYAKFHKFHMETQSRWSNLYYEDHENFEVMVNSKYHPTPYYAANGSGGVVITMNGFKIMVILSTGYDGLHEHFKSSVSGFTPFQDTLSLIQNNINPESLIVLDDHICSKQKWTDCPQINDFYQSGLVKAFSESFQAHLVSSDPFLETNSMQLPFLFNSNERRLINRWKSQVSSFKTKTGNQLIKPNFPKRSCNEINNDDDESSDEDRRYSLISLFNASNQLNCSCNGEFKQFDTDDIQNIDTENNDDDDINKEDVNKNSNQSGNQEITHLIKTDNQFSKIYFNLDLTFNFKPIPIPDETEKNQLIKLDYGPCYDFMSDNQDEHDDEQLIDRVKRGFILV